MIDLYYLCSRFLIKIWFPVELKEKILEASKKLIRVYGFKRVRVEDICQELQISKKTFYTVFKTKNDLVASILEDVRKSHDSSKRFFTAESEENIIDQLLTNTEKIKQAQSMAKKHFQMYLDLEKYYPEILQQHLSTIKISAHSITEKMLEIGISQGIFRSDMDVRFTAIVVTDILDNILPYSQRYKFSMINSVDMCLEAVFRIICSPEGLSYYQQKISDKNINCKKIKIS